MKPGYPTNAEFRRFRADELRVDPDGNGGGLPPIVGYAAVFNQLSHDLGGFREYIKPGAFTSAIEDCDVRALIDHNQSLVLGRKKAGTLRMVQDDVGLRVWIKPSNVQYARDLIENIADGNIDEMSFGFVTVDDDWSMRDGVPTRELRKCHLFDVSAVTYGAYPQTSVFVALRSDDPAMRGLAEFRCRHGAASNCAAQSEGAGRSLATSRLELEWYEAFCRAG